MSEAAEHGADTQGEVTACASTFAGQPCPGDAVYLVTAQCDAAPEPRAVPLCVRCTANARSGRFACRNHPTQLAPVITVCSL